MSNAFAPDMVRHLKSVADPALAPDGSRVVFHLRMGGGKHAWRVARGFVCFHWAGERMQSLRWSSPRGLRDSSA